MLKDVFIRYLEVIRFVCSAIAVAGYEEGFGSSGSRGTTSNSTLVSGLCIYMDLLGFFVLLSFDRNLWTCLPKSSAMKSNNTSGNKTVKFETSGEKIVAWCRKNDSPGMPLYYCLFSLFIYLFT